MGDVAKETKAQYCTEHINVNEEATWIESEWTYPERSDSKLTEVWANAEVTNHCSDVMRCYQKSAEVIVDRKRSHHREMEAFTENRRTEC